VVFLVVNLGGLMLAIPLARVATSGFVPVYVVDDVTLSTVSLVQGLLFRWWWSRRRAEQAGDRMRLRGRAVAPPRLIKGDTSCGNSLGCSSP
jgi:hypothetical protein